MHRIRCNCFQAVALALVAFIPACSSAPDPKKAQTAVETVLEKWKTGGSPQQLAEKSIEIAEPDWTAGYRLVDFKIKSATNFPQQGPRVVVVLSLQTRAGKKFDREVAYEVIMKDKTRIGRDAFHTPQ